ncbi:uncharacterized protein LOC144865178 [Branchiostoma floridae x Branchiostoma japonicum]
MLREGLNRHNINYLSSECSAVLLINDQYGTSTTNRQVAQIITGAGRKVYSAVIKATPTDRRYAEADKVELILPTCSKGDTREPSIDWLTFDHLIRYPSLPQDVRCIVGHADVTSKAAVAFKELRFPQAHLGLVIGTIPEDTEKYKDEEKAMGIGGKEESIRQDAEKADTVFSVGHRIHDHITNSFRAIPENKRPTHHLFLPKPSDLFQKTTVEFRETKEKVVLSIGGVNMVERLKGHDLTAKSLAMVAERGQVRILWRVCNISKEEYQASMHVLQACIESGKLKPTLFTEDTQEDICRHMQQAHLVLMPSRAEPFGLVGLEAMAAGMPVLISDQSGLATLVDKVIPEFHPSVLEIEGNDSVDVARWAGQIEKVLRKSKAEFSRASDLKAKLLKSRYWEESHQCFLQACGGAATCRNVETTRPDQSLEDPRSTRLATGNPDLPVHLHLGMVQQPTAAGVQAVGDIHLRVLERLLELESTLFTIDVLRDRERYEEMREIFLSHKALLKDAITGSFILLLTFLRQTDVDRFYHNHYRVGEGSLSQQLSHILISEHLQDKVKGAQLMVRLQVKHEDYVRVRERLGQGLDRTTSVDNLLAPPPPSRQVNHSNLSSLDLASTDGTNDIMLQYRQVQSAVRTSREKFKEVKVQLQTMQRKVLTGRQELGAMRKEVKMLKEKNRKAEKVFLEQKAGMKEKIQQLQETNKNMATMIEELLPAKQMVEAVRPIRKGQPWVRKVSFGGDGSSEGKFYFPNGVAVSRDNEVYIADSGNRRIQVFTMDGVYVRKFTTIDEEVQLEDVAVDRNDNLWVVGEDHVVQYSREGTCLAKIDIPYAKNDCGIAVTMTTELVLVTEYDGKNGRLRVFDQDGSEVDTYYDSGHRSLDPWRPCCVTVDGEGNILITDCNNHCVHVLDREGNFKFKFGSEGSDESQLKYPQGICVDGIGNIIVTDFGKACVKMFDRQGRFLCDIGSGMEWPRAVAVSPGGDVVVTDFKDHTVSIWTFRGMISLY